MDPLYYYSLLGLCGLLLASATVRFVGWILNWVQTSIEDRRDARCGASLMAETMLFEATRQE